MVQALGNTPLHSLILASSLKCVSFEQIAIEDMTSTHS